MPIASPSAHGKAAVAGAKLLLRSDSSDDIKFSRDGAPLPATPLADRKLRHASTFVVRGKQSVANPGGSPTRLMALGRSERFLQRPSLDMLTADAKSFAASSSSSLKMSAKLERALLLKDKCERELEQFCESKNRRRHRYGLASPTGCGALEGTLWLEAERADDVCAQEKLALERLVRRIAPSLSNGAVSHTDLLHMLHACRECSTRVAFCSVCAARASEFFNGYTASELLALYGRDLPPADPDALEAFSAAIAAREACSTRVASDS